MPVFGGVTDMYAHPRGSLACLEAIERGTVIADFAHGFVRVEQDGDRLLVADLRMGLTPNYVFRFAVAENRDGTLVPLSPPARLRGPRNDPGDQPWLMAMLRGVADPRPAEAASVLATLAPSQEISRSC